MPRVSDSVVNALARAIADAKAGSIEAIALVVVGPDGRPRVHFAGEADLAPSIYMGAGIIQATLMGQLLTAPAAVQMNSGIVIPGRG
jgi:hypothetical protein